MMGVYADAVIGQLDEEQMPERAEEKARASLGGKLKKSSEYEEALVFGQLKYVGVRVHP